MKKPLKCVFAVVLLVYPVCAWERLGKEPEKFKGHVKTVRTKTSQLTKESSKWVNHGEPFERVEEISGRSKSADEDTKDLDDGTGSPESSERDPIKAKQGEGYDAGYGTSHGGYGFYKVDKIDNILEAVHYSSKGELAGKDFYIYDANRYEIEKARFSADGTALSRRISRYDGAGNKIDETEFSSDGTVQRKHIWTYDSNNNVTLESFFEAGVLKYKLTYIYEYDRLGNWLKRVKITEGFDTEHPTRDTMEVAERVILYR